MSAWKTQHSENCLMGLPCCSPPGSSTAIHQPACLSSMDSDQPKQLNLVPSWTGSLKTASALCNPIKCQALFLVFLVSCLGTFIFHPDSVARPVSLTFFLQNPGPGFLKPRHEPDLPPASGSSRTEASLLGGTPFPFAPYLGYLWAWPWTFWFPVPVPFPLEAFLPLPWVFHVLFPLRCELRDQSALLIIFRCLSQEWYILAIRNDSSY